MTDTLAPAGTITWFGRKFFYFRMALVCSTIAFVGFLPTYWTPMAAGTLSKAPIVHIHGLIFFAWSAYIAFQSWLGATGQLVRHRAVGLIGVSLITAMVIFGILVTIYNLRENAASKPEFAFHIAALGSSQILLFAGMVALALYNTRRSDWHKRLMLMATISILGAPIGRWFIHYLHMPPPVPMAGWCVDFLALVPLLHDWRTNGRLHAANVSALVAIFVVQLGTAPFSQTNAWHAVAGWMASLAG